MSSIFKIDQINDREIRVNESRIYLNSDSIICNEAHGSPNKESAIAIKEANLSLASMNGKITNVLVDLTHAGKPSLEARKVLKTLIECPEIGKFAFMGSHPVANVLATFYIGISKKKNIAFFNSQTEALTWLKEK